MTDKQCANFLFEDDRFLILFEKKTFEKKEGKWELKTEREVVTPEFYTNYITAVPFFNNFSDDTSCKVKESYTPAGKLPTTIVTIAPGKETKIVTNFVLLSKREMKNTAGYREKEILTHADHWKLLPEDNSQMLYLYASINEEEKSAIYDINRKEWRG